ncbi:MAG TPA: undecaprenyldiphospho-muramoylpentapeptide beta-N-acetylglucosaminyltransferase, partial [Armatimonadota bacterium]|nr:undecaprenyldiphospho-muramoylpentapeptide beta-N-acetylglucosaminyltransferase [Armatimonadota bacterium]
MRIALSGGGTGGHIYPALSIARRLRESGAELLFVGSQHGPEGKLAEQEGLRFIAVPSGPMAGLASVRTLKSIGKLGLGVLKAYSVLKEFKPDVLVGTGGYTSAGVAVAQWLRGGKVVIHEQNSVPGRTNLMLARIAKKVCVTFDESEKYFPQNKTIVTGLPVRPEIISGMDKRLARESLGLDPDKFTVLVFGGSQGAKRINEMVLDAAGHLLSAGLQVVHQSGKKNYDEVISRQPKVDGYVILPYIEDMATAYSAADLVVSRSGASSIAEITVSGLPSILIPYPFAHANHQKANAQAVSRAGGAIILEESEID